MEKTYLNDKYQGKQRSWNTVENAWLPTGTAWGGALKKHLIKIERSLNKAVNIMLLKGKFESAQPLFQYLNIVPLHLNINLQQSKFMKKLILCQHPDSIQEYLPITYSTSKSNTNNTKLILLYYNIYIGLQREFHHYFLSEL